jgi:hypothetical protein
MAQIAEMENKQIQIFGSAALFMARRVVSSEHDD